MASETDLRWRSVAAEEGHGETWRFEAHPFGSLTVYSSRYDRLYSRADRPWHVWWRPNNSAAIFAVTGWHADREAAQAAAVRWLADACDRIEQELGAEEALITVPGWCFACGAIAALAVAGGAALLLRWLFQ